jgi:hypothetical protein
MIRVVILAALAWTLLIIGACASHRAALYSAELERCRSFAHVCDEYVECRKEAARSFGREYVATCAKDGGSD